MKINEYQTNRHAEAVRRREERERAAYEAHKAAAELADAHAELEDAQNALGLLGYTEEEEEAANG